MIPEGMTSSRKITLTTHLCLVNFSDYYSYLILLAFTDDSDDLKLNVRGNFEVEPLCKVLKNNG